jgi:nucleoside-diphosphate-sugar epimerase
MKSPFYSSYALTKKQGDELAESYCRANKIPLTILRPSQIYGDSDSFAKHQPFFLPDHR